MKRFLYCNHSNGVCRQMRNSSALKEAKNMYSLELVQQISRPALLALALFTLGIIALTQQSFVESMSLLPSPSKLPQPGVSPTPHSDIYGGVVAQSDPCAAERARLTSLENELRQLSNNPGAKAEIEEVREAAERRIQQWHQRNDREVNQLRQRLASPQCPPPQLYPTILPYDLVSSGPVDTGGGRLNTPRWD